MAHAQQLEFYTASGNNLTGIDKDRVFAPVCLLDHKYYIEKYPEYYFIVRKDKHCKDPDCERICLYQEGVVNEYLKGDAQPFTLWISNELRCGRRIETIYRDMQAKADELNATDKHQKELAERRRYRT